MAAAQQACYARQNKHFDCIQTITQGTNVKIIYDYIAIIAFFVVFKFYGIYWATAAAIIISGIQLISYRLIYKRFDKMYLITFGVIFVLGGATLLLHNAIFIKWKPTIIYWAMAIALFISTRYGKKTLLERLLGEKIALPKPIWLSMTEAWGYFFLGLGMLNIYVLYHFSTAAWVNFKLFGTIGLIVVFTIFTSIYMNKYIIEQDENKPPKSGPRAANDSPSNKKTPKTQDPDPNQKPPSNNQQDKP